jgi:hypothetical protein
MFYFEFFKSLLKFNRPSTNYCKLPLKNPGDRLFSDADYSVLKGMFKNINENLYS